MTAAVVAVCGFGAVVVNSVGRANQAVVSVAAQRIGDVELHREKCLPDVSTNSLNAIFDLAPGRFFGADYQRAYPLGDGRTLWLFQDVVVGLPGGGSRLVHNAGLLQTATCFLPLIGGTADNPQPLLFADQTVPYRRWFWALGAVTGGDGNLYIFTAEMNEQTDSYLGRVVPVATHVARFNVVTGTVDQHLRPGDGSPSLYGWAIASDADYHYLYAHCYRQFGFDPLLDVMTHDSSCSGRVTMARVPNGHPLEAPEYWAGNGRWSSSPSVAVPVFAQSDRRRVNPVQVVARDGRFVAVTKVDDWWATEVIVETSASPTGPFREALSFDVPLMCAECNNYFASIVPTSALLESQPFGRFIVAVSNNRWDGIHGGIYRPRFYEIVVL